MAPQVRSGRSFLYSLDANCNLIQLPYVLYSSIILSNPYLSTEFEIVPHPQQAPSKVLYLMVICALGLLPKALCQWEYLCPPSETNPTDFSSSLMRCLSAIR